MTDLTQKIKQARPRIDAISPIVAKAIIGFALFNIVLGLSLFTLKAYINPDFALISYLFQYKLWGVLFFGLGVTKLFAYLRNDWKLMKLSILIALFFKMMWLFALAFRLFSGDYGNAIVFILWSVITYLQALTYIYFIPQHLKDTTYDLDR